MGDFLEKIGKNCFQAGKIWVFDGENGGMFVFELLWGVKTRQNSTKVGQKSEKVGQNSEKVGRFRGDLGHFFCLERLIFNVFKVKVP
jgi:hypothetical protein